MKAIVRKVSSSFEKALAKYFGSGPTDLNEAIRQHDAYVNKLVEFGLSVKVIDSHSKYPDCCFVEDHAIVAGNSALLTNAGHDSRLGERKEIEETLNDDLNLEYMSEGARMDGGDVLRFGDTFLVGHSKRTNRKGIEDLEEFLKKRGYGLHVIEVPSESLHLISVCTSPISGKLLAPFGWFKESEFPSDSEILWVPQNEAYAANILPFGNKVMMAKGYPSTFKILQDLNLEIHEMEMSQFREADGSLTCLSVLYD
ncbi:MAG: hypothetical protein BEU00_00145 [Marine Group III euryarchaeote CG-Epi3]|jgi:dimethylargininase|uniref:N(G),N(G)-dimethylarginine dimethylaminohydrolase n=1 Tax=Marine Group III euryarchaeote CG-Epi3 TaxID=1888997 RepID=A0A1J5UH83_9ARCH|nr:MAG: hypothetical protein BEU00_00145 [Marine Group III euryarchaeote CG-Epi3]|tara:strand:+ start:300 stop:1064 length:765 start_codon:yes stop_codon:yes gene_type:complete